MNLLQSLIERISTEASGRPYPVNKVLVTVDPNTNTADERRPLWKKDRYHYYLLSPQVVENYPSTYFQVRKEADRLMTIAITLTGVKIAVGKEKAVALKLGGDDSPAEALKRAIDRFNENFVREKGIDPFEHFDIAREKWGQYLSERMQSLGLEAEVRVDLPVYSEVFDIIQPQPCVVYPSDSDEAVPVTYTLGVEPVLVGQTSEPVAATGGQTAIQYKYLPQLQLSATIQTEVGRYIQENIGLHQLACEEQIVKEHLRGHLVGFLETYRLRVRFLKFRAEPVFGRNLPQGLSHLVECLVEPNEKKVTVKHALRLTWTNAGLLRRKGASPSEVEEYLKKVLEDATCNELIDKTYGELVIGFEDYKLKIKERVQAKLEEAGCEIQQLVTLNDLEHGSLIRDGFRFTTEPHEYETSDSDVNFGLRISVSGHFVSDQVSETVIIEGAQDTRESGPITREYKLLEFLKPGWNFVDAATSEIRKYVEQVLERKTPEDLYLYFARKREEKNSLTESPDGEYNAVTVKAQIEGGLEERMSERFGARCSITATPVDTRIGKLFRELLQFPLQTLSLPIEPLDAPGERVACELSYLVRGMDRGGWHSFQKRCRNPDAQSIVNEITEHVKIQATRDLEALQSGALAYLGVSEARRIESGPLGPTRRVISDVFGLTIAIAFRRGKTQDELTLVETAKLRRQAFLSEKAAQIISVQDQIEHLRAKLKNAADLIPEERKDIEQNLAELEKRLVQQTGDIQALPLPESKSRLASSLDDYDEPDARPRLDA